MVAAGWHMHLDVLVARATGQEPMPFWDGWNRLKEAYDPAAASLTPAAGCSSARSTGRSASSRCTQASDANAKATASRPRR